MRVPSAAQLLTEAVFSIWDCLGSALTFQFLLEIGRSNALDDAQLRHWDDRAENGLEDELGGTTETHRRNAGQSLADEFELAVFCLAIEQIWAFAIREVATLLGRDTKDLMLPDRTVVVNDLFKRARKLFSIRARTNGKWGAEKDYLEIRTQGTLETGAPALDEIVARGASIHLEQMNHDGWWMGIEAGGKHFHLNFGVTDGRLWVHLMDQDDEGAEWNGDSRERLPPG
jgi:hypothetical protein